MFCINLLLKKRTKKTDIVAFIHRIYTYNSIEQNMNSQIFIFCSIVLLFRITDPYEYCVQNMLDMFCDVRDECYVGSKVYIVYSIV